MERLLQSARHLNVGDGERWTSIVGGSALLFYGMQRRSLAGLGLALLGGSLVYRGATGRCGLYSLLGVNTAQADHRGSDPRVLTDQKARTKTETRQTSSTDGRSSPGKPVLH
jgi:uncharacterized membrane protein